MSLYTLFWIIVVAYFTPLVLFLLFLIHHSYKNSNEGRSIIEDIEWRLHKWRKN